MPRRMGSYGWGMGHLRHPLVDREGLKGRPQAGHAVGGCGRGVRHHEEGMEAGVPETRERVTQQQPGGTGIEDVKGHGEVSEAWHLEDGPGCANQEERIVSVQ